ncbi:MAG: aminotransferase class V-fold PLP-dependent enzyme [Firmicutes bacterium]|nr:aminotransferase class V-fold PLP-dependent enzyme [Bacillota bacterium]
MNIYLNNAATSFPKPESVYRSIDEFNRFMGGSPGRGSIQNSIEAGSVLFNAREALAEFFNIGDSSQIAFSLNVTEAINTALKGLLRPGDHVITSSMEHNSVARPLHGMSGAGVEWTRVRCAPDGSLDPNDFKKEIRGNTRLICILHASNVTGTIMPIDEVSEIARDSGVLFMVDAAQTAGVLPLDVEQQGIDLLAFTGHKSMLGPQGTGGLYIRPGIEVGSLKEGGTGSSSENLEHPDFMPDHLESGTPNTPGIAGLLAGVEFIKSTGLDRIRSHEMRLTDLLVEGLREIPGVKLYGPGSGAKQTAVVSFNIEGMACSKVGQYLENLYHVVNRSGLHCSPLAHQNIGTLQIGTCRLSPGWFNTEEEIVQTIRAVYRIARNLN